MSPNQYKLFVLITKLQSIGTFSIENATGAIGEVYLNIPEKGNGRVLVNFNNRLREYDAMSGDNREIPTGTFVRVLWVEGDVMYVEEI